MCIQHMPVDAIFFFFFITLIINYVNNRKYGTVLQ